MTSFRGNQTFVEGIFLVGTSEFTGDLVKYAKYFQDVLRERKYGAIFLLGITQHN